MNSSQQVALVQNCKQTPRELSVSQPELYQALETELRQIFVERLSVLYAEYPIYTEQIHNVPIPLPLDAQEGRTIAESILQALSDNPSLVDPEFHSALTEDLPSEAGFGMTILETVRPDMPYVDNPLWVYELSAGKLHMLGQMAELTVTQVEQLLEVGVEPATATDENLQALVIEGMPLLTEVEAGRLGWALDLVSFLDGNIVLASAFLQANTPDPNATSAENLRGLTSWELTQWRDFLNLHETLLPEGTDASGYADVLLCKVELLYPTDLLIKNLTRTAPVEWEEALNALQPLFEVNPSPFPLQWDELDLSSFPPHELDTMQMSYDKLYRLIHKYPGLELEGILNHPVLPHNEKVAELEVQIQWLSALRSDNSGIELLAFDFAPDNIEGELNVSSLEPEQQIKTLRLIKTYQRMYGVAQNLTDALLLVENGWKSAAAIIGQKRDDFVGMDFLSGATASERAHLIYERAEQAANQSLAASMAAFDAINGGFSESGVGNLNSDIKSFFKRLDNVSTLFGSQSSCHCKHCQSILSPAAYFVDLMYFVEKHVVQKHFTGGQANHPLNLAVRRGDLWELPLTCENTHEKVPYLEIVNTVLENFIATRILGYTGDTNDRASVESLIYETHLPSLANVQSFKRPFSLATWELSAFLKLFGYEREQLVRAWGASSEIVTQAKLGLSKEEFILITQSNANLSFLQTLYHIPAQVSLVDLDVQRLLAPTGLKRAELGKILSTIFVTQEGQKLIQIQGVKKTSDSIQVDHEIVKGLDVEVLDRLHRFVRLLNRLPWQIKELDEVLTQLGLSKPGAGLDIQNLDTIVEMMPIQERWSLSVEEWCALWLKIPQTSMFDGERSLLDRLFNAPRFVTNPTEAWPNGVLFAYQSNPSTPEESKRHQRLQAGLQVSNGELGVLIQNLMPALVQQPADTQFPITLDNLSLMYRHVQIAKKLKLSVQAFFLLLNKAPGLTAQPISHLDRQSDLSAFIAFVDFWRESGIELDTLSLVLEGVKTNSTWSENIATKAKEIVEQAAKEESLLFADTVFTEIVGVNEKDSIDFVENNKQVILRTSDGKCRLVHTYDPEQPNNHPLQMASHLLPLEGEFRKVLKRYDMVELLQDALGRTWGVGAEHIWQCAKLNGVALRSPAVYDELHKISGGSSALAAVMEKYLPIVTALVEKDSGLNLLPFAYDVPAVFGMVSHNSHTLQIQQWQKIDIARRYLKKYKKQEQQTFRDVLKSFTVSSNSFSINEKDKLAKLFETEPYVVESILKQPISLSLEPLAAFQKLERNIQIAKKLGMNSDVLVWTASEQHSKLRQASRGLWTAFRARYSSEKKWQKIVEPYEDKIRVAKRDGLIHYLLQRPGSIFESSSDLYRYFLLDPEMGGCARTSHVLSAISSVQLYIHRCLMNLEQDELSNILVLPSDFPKEEWSWRKNYRVWEANRKVFLYPENYIEPELRDDKTPLFKEIEAKLLEREVNEDTVMQAYAEYLRGFEEISKLSIAGSYHEKSLQGARDRLHLFGVTSDTPGRYYYRAIDNLHSTQKTTVSDVHWGPWQKLELQIPSRKVSPIVFRGRLYVFWVELSTVPVSKEQGTSQRFVGYHHNMVLRYVYQFLNGSWSVPQTLALDGFAPFVDGEGVIPDLNRKVNSTTYAALPHKEPQKGYTLKGYDWEQVFPHIQGKTVDTQRLAVTGRGFQMESAPLDLYGSSVKEPFSTGVWNPASGKTTPVRGRLSGNDMLHLSGDKLYSGKPIISFLDRYSFSSILIEEARFQEFHKQLKSVFKGVPIDPNFTNRCKQRHLLTMHSEPKDSMVINQSFGSGIFDLDGDLIFLQNTKRIKDKATLYRLNTSLTQRMGHKLFSQGVFALLDTEFQENELRENKLPLTLTHHILDKTFEGSFSDNGAMGSYFRELFFHIPFLLADHLNSQGKYEEAQKWYHTIFDPTHEEVPGPNSHPVDRNWRYRGFRKQKMERLRDILTDTSAIQTYMRKPFNPHAIARLRISSYPKSIVMKYIDNLLDWGDALFSEDTVESINEAMLLYVMALDILGKRPIELGDCETPPASKMTFRKIAKESKKGSDFLAELEHIRIVQQPLPRSNANTFTYAYTLEPSLWSEVNELSKSLVPELSTKHDGETVFTPNGQSEFYPSPKSEYGVYQGEVGTLEQDSTSVSTAFGTSITTQLTPVFCIPSNPKWSSYWDRVEDRMYKIRHCMNISGVQRELSLLAPELDPALLVKARAAGVPISELKQVVQGSLPPYRFAFIIEKAKEYASAVQQFGGALLGAIERRDTEELEALRLLHEKNIQFLTRKSQELELKLAKESSYAAQQQLATARLRELHYTLLMRKGKFGSEQQQVEFADHASTFQLAASIYQGLAATAALLIDGGYPTAMTYGGTQLRSMLNLHGTVLQLGANRFNTKSTLAALQAGFERREQGWRFLKEQAEQELEQAEFQLNIATLREKLTNHSFRIFEENIKQLEEQRTLFSKKFAGFGLYNWLVAQLQKMYREAFNSALAMARLAESAYQFERGKTATVPIASSIWESGKVGLLAGERLLLQLQHMEREFIQTNYRSLEIDQSFSIAQIAPLSLLKLREEGECSFSIPELSFDLFYPGQYRRVMKSARLTIPSITGPYVNVSATLSLVSSKVRSKPDATASLSQVPLSRTVSIATSSAQNDAGVFEFNFRDERYMPFEGMGAISTWKLQLPKNFRAFDYNSISDVILHISYTAESNEEFRKVIEDKNQQVGNNILASLKDTNAPMKRVISLRQEFSSMYHRLLRNVNQAVTFRLEDKHFPYLFYGKDITLRSASLVIFTKDGVNPNTPDSLGDNTAFKINSTSINTFTPGTQGGSYPAGYWSSEVTNAFGSGIRNVSHTLTLEKAGSLAPSGNVPGGPAIDEHKLLDLFLVVDYTLR